MSLLKIYDRDKIEHLKEFYSKAEYSVLKVLGRKIPPFYFDSDLFVSYKIYLQEVNKEYLSRNELNIAFEVEINETLQHESGVTFKINKTANKYLEHSKYYRLKIELELEFTNKTYYSDLFCAIKKISNGDYSDDYNDDYDN